MPVKIFNRKPDTVDAFKLERNPDDLREAAKWCDGTLVLAFDGGDIVYDSTYITFKLGALPPIAKGVSVVPEDRRAIARAKIGDYIIKYWDTAKHEPGFFMVNGEHFETEYEAR